MAGNAFTAGVKPGGLTTSTEIRILLCYLIQHAGTPLSQGELETALLGEELVNYFELASNLSNLLEQGFVREENGCCFSERMRKTCCDFATKRQKKKGVYNGLKSPCKRLLNTCENGSFRRRWREHSSLSSAPFVMHSAARRWRVPQPCLHRPRRRSRPPKRSPRCRGSVDA